MKIEMRKEMVDPLQMMAMHEIHYGRAKGYARLMDMGRSFPPVVAVRYDDRIMPLDGHHRLTAAKIRGCRMAAWVIDGDDFEALCERFRTDGRGHPDMMLINMCVEMDQ